MRTPASGTVLLATGYGNWIDVALIASSGITSPPYSMAAHHIPHGWRRCRVSTFPPASESWIGIPRILRYVGVRLKPTLKAALNPCMIFRMFDGNQRFSLFERWRLNMRLPFVTMVTKGDRLSTYPHLC